MKCLMWYREKANKEPKLYLKLVGERGRMEVVLEAILEIVYPGK